MRLQYITDDNGDTPEVFIPIQEWNKLKSKYQGIEEDMHIVPEWQKEIVRERIKNTEPGEYLSWDEVRQQLKFD